MNGRTYLTISLLLVFGLVLSACGPTSASAAQDPSLSSAALIAPLPTAAPEVHIVPVVAEVEAASVPVEPPPPVVVACPETWQGFPVICGTSAMAFTVPAVDGSPIETTRAAKAYLHMADSNYAVLFATAQHQIGAGDYLTSGNFLTGRLEAVGSNWFAYSKAYRAVPLNVVGGLGMIPNEIHDGDNPTVELTVPYCGVITLQIGSETASITYLNEVVVSGSSTRLFFDGFNSSSATVTGVLEIVPGPDAGIIKTFGIAPECLNP